MGSGASAEAPKVDASPEEVKECEEEERKEREEEIKSSKLAKLPIPVASRATPDRPNAVKCTWDASCAVYHPSESTNAANTTEEMPHLHVAAADLIARTSVGVSCELTQF